MPRELKFDPQEVLTLYLCGMTIAAIAEDEGVSRDTIYRFLKSQDVEIRSNRRGPAKADTCPKGHGREHAVPKIYYGEPNRKPGRTCGICRQERWRRHKAKKREQKLLQSQSDATPQEK